MVAVVEEVRKAKDVLLVLDNLHCWESFPYALAPLAAALMRGTIRCVAVAAGMREPPGFEPVRLEALTPAATVAVLAALRGRYAEHHHVRIADEAIQAAAESAGREGGRRLPGIAVDVLDEACALVRLRTAPVSAELTEMDERMARLDREKEEAVRVQDFEKAARCRAETDALRRERDKREREADLPIVDVVDAAAVAEVLRLRGA